jgi:hypothetical protein
VFLTSFKIQQIIECIDKKRWIILVCYLKQIIVIITRFCSLYILAPWPSTLWKWLHWRTPGVARWKMITMGDASDQGLVVNRLCWDGGTEGPEVLRAWNATACIMMYHSTRDARIEERILICAYIDGQAYLISLGVHCRNVTGPITSWACCKINIILICRKIDCCMQVVHQMRICSMALRINEFNASKWLTQLTLFSAQLNAYL